MHKNYIGYKQIIKKLGEKRVKINEPMIKHTTFQIGGPADLFYEATSQIDFTKAVKLAKNLKINFFVLGNGSNLLVSDEGFRGIVIKNVNKGARIVGRLEKPILINEKKVVPYEAVDTKKYLMVDDLDFLDGPLRIEIEVEAGTSLQSLIRWSFENGLIGLQWFAGIPATVGGAVISNVHGYTRLFSNYIKSIKAVDKKGNLRQIGRGELTFDYDFSDVLEKYLAVVSVNLILGEGNLARAKKVYDEWRRRKLKAQPQRFCPGSIFKNISQSEALKINSPTPSAGWLVEQCGLKGKIIGRAQISPIHANFIVNLGGARAKDVVALIDFAKEEVKKKFKVELCEEIVKIGEF